MSHYRSQYIQKNPCASSFPLRKSASFWIHSILFALILLFGVSYLLTVNSASTKGYEMSQLKQKAEELSRENKRLEVEVMNLQSLGSISQKMTALNMVPVESVSYLESTHITMAKK